MHKRVLIGVTGPDRGGLVAWLMTALALRRCGAWGLRISPSRPCDPSRLHGLVIGGGTDVHPLQYGSQDTEPDEPGDEEARDRAVDWLVGLLLGLFRRLFAVHSLQRYDPDRDRMEKHLIEHALYNELPILGICRGAQLINVVFNGSLHRDIGHFYTEDTRNVRSVLPRKSIAISPGSALHAILRRERCRVNALHRQAIDQLGRDLAVSARERNGVIQAIEKSDHPFLLGVQWHPEYMPQSATQRRLFQRLVTCAQQRRAAG
ncbi:MAG: gamma-glutamyl-gamma-aminobutyrate hydrolase family protein [Halioglobus sp.]|nr:gamma-glutamyl-gamma-aminobutyrate hydrolase family protein [Halioglobus sp.]